ncbi:MAG: DUF1571 domain-containing protein [Planctomycetota bacterium]|nr:DUF1571 domain-containing protein [Planctomycetota bacterium]
MIAQPLLRKLSAMLRFPFRAGAACRSILGTRSRNLLAVLCIASAVGYLAIDASRTPHHSKPLSQFGFSIPQAPVVATTPVTQVGTRTAVESVSEEQPQPAASVEGRDALVKVIDVLENGLDYLKLVPDYTATFFKQERVNGQLIDGQVVHLKLRHEPFGVYMRWLDVYKGREAIYVDGQNDQKMVVRLDGWRGRLVPVVRLDPFQGRAMKESRYPVTQVGLKALTRMLFADRSRDLQRPEFLSCQFVDGQECNGRDCYYFRLEYASRSASSLYRKSECYLDKQWSLPICIRNFTWPANETPMTREKLDKSTLIEFYSYTDVNLCCGLGDAHFDESNAEYAFRDR